jgi:hypothetical protein
MADFPSDATADREAFARAVIALLDSWGVDDDDQIALLAMPADTRRGAIRAHRQGKPLPEDAGMLERIDHFLGIADALRTSYPHNQAMGGIWMHRKNSRFGDRTPLNAMLEDGLGSILAIRMHLDCSYDWQVDAARTRAP